MTKIIDKRASAQPEPSDESRMITTFDSNKPNVLPYLDDNKTSGKNVYDLSLSSLGKGIKSEIDKSIEDGTIKPRELVTQEQVHLLEKWRKERLTKIRNK